MAPKTLSVETITEMEYIVTSCGNHTPEANTLLSSITEVSDPTDSVIIKTKYETIHIISSCFCLLFLFFISKELNKQARCVCVYFLLPFFTFRLTY